MKARILQNKRITGEDAVFSIRSEDGIALVMVMVLCAVMLAIMTALIYMLTSGTQISGIEKRYKTALDAGFGGADVTFLLIAKRGNPLDASLSSAIKLGITTPAQCTTKAIAECTDIGNFTGLPAKMNLPSECWLNCDDSLTINPLINTSYDMSFQLGSSPFPVYNVYAKVVDAVQGNSGGDEGLLKTGVVHVGEGEITVYHVPYLYSIEVDVQNANTPERAKLSVLYQY